MSISSNADDVEAPSEEGLLGYGRSLHPELLLKIAIAWTDGGPAIGWVKGLYSNEAFYFLKSIHEKIVASTLTECDAQDFHATFKKQAAAAYLALPPAFYFVAFSFIQPPATPLLSFDEQLANARFDATVAHLEACYYATAQVSSAAPQVSYRFRRMLKWSTQDRISVWGKPKCLHAKVEYVSCYECPESGFVPMDHLGRSITNLHSTSKTSTSIRSNFAICTSKPSHEALPWPSASGMGHQSTPAATTADSTEKS